MSQSTSSKPADQDPSAWALEQAGTELAAWRSKCGALDNDGVLWVLRPLLARALDAARAEEPVNLVAMALTGEATPEAAVTALGSETIEARAFSLRDAARAEERAACIKTVKPALLLAQRWLANSIAVSEIPGKEPLPAIAKALAALRTRGEEDR